MTGKRFYANFAEGTRIGARVSTRDHTEHAGMKKRFTRILRNNTDWDWGGKAAE
jgi:hypothetical protein